MLQVTPTSAVELDNVQLRMHCEFKHMDFVDLHTHITCKYTLFVGLIHLPSLKMRKVVIITKQPMISIGPSKWWVHAFKQICKQLLYVKYDDMRKM